MLTARLHLTVDSWILYLSCSLWFLVSFWYILFASGERNFANLFILFALISKFLKNFVLQIFRVLDAGLFFSLDYICNVYVLGI